LQCNQAGRDLGRVPISQLEPGDLLCYLDGQHVGIYEGRNAMINALNENEGVREHDITTPYWTGNFDRARGLWEGAS
jgi:cell wall-associated NlpC family hydrolase